MTNQLLIDEYGIQKKMKKICVVICLLSLMVFRSLLIDYSLTTKVNTFLYRNPTRSTDKYEQPSSTDLIQDALDPFLNYSTFIKGASKDWGTGIAVDNLGQAYIVGITNSSDFPTTSGSFDTSYNGGDNDIFVAKFSADGSTLLYSTFLGGSDYEWGSSIAVDSFGQAYITGSTYSSDFPVTSGAYDTSHNGSANAFIVKLTADGTELSYSTFIGGGSRGGGIAVDTSGQVYVTGSTGSDFPTTSGAYDTSYNDDWDGFIVKLSADGSTLLYSTFLGGLNNDWGNSIVVDSIGQAYITGDTVSSGFPTTTGAYDTSFNGGEYDVFMAKLSTDGSTLLYSTFLGGSSRDIGNSIAVDVTGQVYITGYTYSSDFPTTIGAYDTSYNGNANAFVAKLSTDNNVLFYSTFIGSASGGNEIVVDSTGHAYIIGDTGSSEFPTTYDAYDTSHGGYNDILVVKLSEDGGALLYSTYIGGSDSENGLAIAMDSDGHLYLTGYINIRQDPQDTNFPTSPGAYDTSFTGGEQYTFVLKTGSMADFDQDGLMNFIELDLGLDPYDIDSDGDGFEDFAEIYTYGTNPIKFDSDDDGLSDYEEILTYGTNPLDWDSDNDGAGDGEEILILGTNPFDWDSDNDGVRDGNDSSPLSWWLPYNLFIILLPVIVVTGGVVFVKKRVSKKKRKKPTSVPRKIEAHTLPTIPTPEVKNGLRIQPSTRNDPLFTSHSFQIQPQNSSPMVNPAATYIPSESPLSSPATPSLSSPMQIENLSNVELLAEVKKYQRSQANLTAKGETVKKTLFYKLMGEYEEKLEHLHQEMTRRGLS